MTTGLDLLRERLGLPAGSPLLQWRRPVDYSRDDADPGEHLADRSAALTGVALARGRRTIDELTGPATAVLTLAGPLLTGPAPALGELVRLQLAPALSTLLGINSAALYSARLTGRITGVQLDPNSLTYVLQVTGPRAELDERAYPLRNRTTVTLPAGSTDKVRAEALLSHTALGVSQDVWVGGVATLGDPEQHPVTALTLAPADPVPPALDQLAGDTGAQLLELRAGLFTWRTEAARAAVATPALTLPAEHAIGPVSWTSDAESVFRRVEVNYGTGDPRPRIDAYDVQNGTVVPYRTLALDPQLSTSAGATARASSLIEQRLLPAWSLPDLAVELSNAQLSTSQLRALLQLDHGSLVHVTDMPTPPDPLLGPRVFVEGYAETLTPNSWRLQLAVADAGLFRSARWSEVRAGLRWADVPTLPAPSYDATAGAVVPTTPLIWQATRRWQPI